MSPTRTRSEHKRQSIILVESDRPGVTATKIKGKLGIRASDTAEISFDNVRVPQKNLIGEEGRGFYHLMEFFDATRTMVAAQGVGIAQGALDKAVKYTQERTTFGRPSGFQSGDPVPTGRNGYKDRTVPYPHLQGSLARRSRETGSEPERYGQVLLG